MTLSKFVEDQNIIKRAKNFATDKHQNQKRKFTNEPYIVHSQSVANLVEKYGGDINMIAAAWLHDTLEDTDTTLDELKDHFNNNITQYVLELTSEPIQDKSKKGEIYVQKMNHMSPGALLIKLCDRLNNVSDFDNAKPSFVAKYKPETEYILSNLDNPKINEYHKKIIQDIQNAIKDY